MAHILLIEPDRMLAKTCEQMLAAAGHRLTVCAGAQTAILAADTATPDVVILEVQLIEHSGIEFLYEFRSYPEWQDIPVLIVSQVPPMEFSGSYRVLTKELGVSAYYYKPQTSLRRLLATVNELVAAAA
jgi:DNA-binding response OmpR family regulator